MIFRFRTLEVIIIIIIIKFLSLFRRCFLGHLNTTTSKLQDTWNFIPSSHLDALLLINVHSVPNSPIVFRKLSAFVFGRVEISEILLYLFLTLNIAPLAGRRASVANAVSMDIGTFNFKSVLAKDLFN